MNTLSSQSMTCPLLFLLTVPAIAGAGTSQEEARSVYFAPKAAVPMTIDGRGIEAGWQTDRWRELDRRWPGPEYSASDIQGPYKVVWMQSRIYPLSEIVDIDGSGKLAENSKERGWIDAGLFGSLTLVD